MKFEQVCLASIGYVVPPIEVSSAWIEHELADVYARLKLPEGRLEGMSGIRTRRMWEVGSRISERSAESCRNALQGAGIASSEVGCLIHASVCREYLEPATACRVHHLVGMPRAAWIYDVSNACLGVMNGAVQIAQLIEAGVINAGLVVGTEDSRGLMETTLTQLKNDRELTRQSIKPAFASLTIGSGSCAWLLANRDWLEEKHHQAGMRFLGAVAVARTEFHGLCQSDSDQAGGGMSPLMNTDSEQLLEAGLATGKETFECLTEELRWTRSQIDATVCHQVGAAHRKRMLETLGLPVERDFATYHEYGNTGSVALPTALARAIQSGGFSGLGRGAFLGIGSGVNSLMVGVEFGKVPVIGT